MCVSRRDFDPSLYQLANILNFLICSLTYECQTEWKQSHGGEEMVSLASCCDSIITIDKWFH